jgi:hypothetical protein
VRSDTVLFGAFDFAAFIADDFVIGKTARGGPQDLVVVWSVHEQSLIEKEPIAFSGILVEIRRRLNRPA